MDLNVLGQSILNGLAAGWIYVLVALGLMLIFSILGIVQLAHGELYMLGAYGTYYFFSLFGLNFWLALLISAILVSVLGLILERFLFRPFSGNFELALIVAMGLMIFLQTIGIVAFGGYNQAMPSIIPGVLIIWGFRLSIDRLLAILVGIILVTGLFFLIQRTRIGQAMLAVSQDMYAAALQGVDVNRVSAVAFAIGSALAAIAGSLMGCILSITPSMGSFAISKGIAVIILGGLGSIPGAIVGGLILGLVDGIIPPFLSSTVAAIISFLVIIILLLLRPRGLFGHA